MRLSYIEPIRLPTEKAHGYQIMKTCEALAASGMAVDLVVADRRNSIGEKNPFAYYGLPESFTLRRLPALDLLGILPSNRLAFRLLFRSFARSLRRARLGFSLSDAWYARDPATAEILLGLPNAKPVFLELHNATDAKRLSRLAGWIVISQGLKRELLKQGVPEEKILVAHDGFDPAAFERLPSKQAAREKLGIARDAFLVVYAGHLYPWKGMDGIASAFRDIPEGVELAIVGGYPSDIDRVKSIAGETRRVRFIGQLPRSEVSAWLAAADAALLPTSAKFEIGKSYTSPLKLFEYLAAGLPILASDVPSNHEILDESVARFFKPDDAQDFLQRLTEMKRATFEPDRAKERVKPYAWSERGKKIAEFITSHTKPTSVSAKKGVLIVTQAVDLDDSNLAFFMSWLIEFSSHFPIVYVATWKKGSFPTKEAWPKNVKVFEMPKGKLPRIIALMWLTWRIRNRISCVFVHMLAPVAAALGWYWRMFGKNVVLWYTHGSVPLSLRFAELQVNAITTATEESMRLKTAKKIVTGHGIDTVLINPERFRDFIQRKPDLITVGRVTKRKKIEVLFDLCEKIRMVDPSLDFHLYIVGEPYLDIDREYQTHLNNEVARRNLTKIVIFSGAVRHDLVVTKCELATLFVTASETGSLDKAVLESLASETPALARSKVFAGFVGVRIAGEDWSDEDVMFAVELLRHPRSFPEAHADVEKKASLKNLVTRLVTILLT